MPGPASCSGRQSLPRPPQGLSRGQSYVTKGRRSCRARNSNGKIPVLQTILSAESQDGAPQESLGVVAEDGWIARTLAAFRKDSASAQTLPGP